jgi:hypothetical protein
VNGDAFVSPIDVLILLNRFAATNLNIEPVNDLPTITGLKSLALPEGFAFTTETFSASPGPQEDQPIRVTAVSNNNAIVPNPTVQRLTDGTYQMTLLPPVGASGMATIVVTVEDGGLDRLLETSNDNLSSQASFAVIVTQDQRGFR